MNIEREGIKVVEKPITRNKAKEIANERYGDMLKAVVDVEKGIMAIGGELHADEESLLIELNSKQENLWGVNIYVDLPREKWVEFDSIINIRPNLGNNSRYVENEIIRKRIVEIINSLIVD